MKYKLTETTKVVYGITLYQIIALTSFGSIKEGDLGGYIATEKNLSQEGNARVSGDAKLTRRGQLIVTTGIRSGITVTPQHIQIGCKQKTLDEWLQTIDLEGENHGYSQEERDLIRTMLPLYHAQVMRHVEVPNA